MKSGKPKPTIPRLVDALREFTELESASGTFLVVAAAIALLFANTRLNDLYHTLLDTPITVAVGEFAISKRLLLWINDGLMTVFFFLVGLEIKREILQGELSDARKTALPLAAAAGGMAAPALLYAAMNWGDTQAMKGWAIPATTDIAFALGVLALLANRVPNALKVFLLTLAIADDLGAIVIIALFYSELPSFTSLAVAAAAFTGLVTLNLRGVVGVAPYLLIGVVLWVAVLKSGVHATIAGVLLAFTIPLRTPHAQPPLLQLEHDLNAPVAFGILPLFAFANAGVPLADMTWRMVIHPVPLGIAAGLFFGKQLGVFASSWLVVQLGIARLPRGVSWGHLYGVAVLCGIGFTMSLFIGKLAFIDEDAAALPVDERSGILLGSLVSALVGYTVLRVSARRRR